MLIRNNAVNKKAKEDMRVKEICYEIVNALHKPMIKSYYEIILSAYLLKKVSSYSNFGDYALNDIDAWASEIPEQIRLSVKEILSEETWKRLLELLDKYKPEDFAAVVLSKEVADNARGPETMLMETPDSLVELAHALLKVKPSEYVADICCGYGNYLVSAAEKEPDAFYYGCDVKVDCSSIALMRADILGKNIQIESRNAFDLVNNSRISSFDKIFANYPFGMRMRSSRLCGAYLEKLTDEHPLLSKTTSSDWLFNALICELLADKGKAVAIMTNGSTWNSIDIPMRKYFVEAGLIECVIALPARMFSYTTIPATMIVMSHNNQGVRLVDASENCSQGRRYTEFSAQDIAQIMQDVETDGKHSWLISLEELRKNEYTLSLNRYLADEFTLKNGTPLKNVIKSITRGAPCNAKQLDEMASESPTNMQYLMLANIKDGMIEDDLPYLSHIDEKYDRYCIKDNDLILSKNGYPYKVTVASIKKGQKILANGNLYVIEVDTEKVYPVFLKAFFESESGIAALKSISVGTVIPNIGVDKLKNLMIPLYSLDEQKRIVDKYMATLDEIGVLQLKLKKATNRLHHIFDEESEE